MLKNTKSFLLFSLLIISSISFVNIAILYWYPMEIPLSSHLAVNLMRIAYFFKAYYFIPICFAICALIFFSALSFLKEKIIMPVILLIYLLCDLFFLTYSFFDAWFNDEYFIAMQAIQIVISITIITFVFIYLILLRKVNQGETGDGSRSFP